MTVQNETRVESDDLEETLCANGYQMLLTQIYARKRMALGLAFVDSVSTIVTITGVDMSVTEDVLRQLPVPLGI